jgi:hypothetical protein
MTTPLQQERNGMDTHYVYLKKFSSKEKPDMALSHFDGGVGWLRLELAPTKGDYSWSYLFP